MPLFILTCISWAELCFDAICAVMDNSTELKKIKLIAQILHYPASSNDLKQKGILIKQEHHDESLHIVLDQEEQVYFPIPAGHQFKF